MQKMRNVSLKDRKVEGDQNEATIICLNIPLGESSKKEKGLFRVRLTVKGVGQPPRP